VGIELGDEADYGDEIQVDSQKNTGTPGIVVENCDESQQEIEIQKPLSFHEKMVTSWHKWKYPAYICIMYYFYIWFFIIKILNTNRYGLYGGFISTSIDTLIPVWLSSPAPIGGMGFSSSETGIVTAIGAGAVIFTQVTVYKPLAKKLGFFSHFH